MNDHFKSVCESYVTADVAHDILQLLICVPVCLASEEFSLLDSALLVREYRKAEHDMDAYDNSYDGGFEFAERVYSTRKAAVAARARGISRAVKAVTAHIRTLPRARRPRDPRAEAKRIVGYAVFRRANPRLFLD